jgi:hypothetical protein
MFLSFLQATLSLAACDCGLFHGCLQARVREAQRQKVAEMLFCSVLQVRH